MRLRGVGAAFNHAYGTLLLACVLSIRVQKDAGSATLTGSDLQLGAFPAQHRHQADSVHKSAGLHRGSAHRRPEPIAALRHSLLRVQTRLLKALQQRKRQHLSWLQARRQQAAQGLVHERRRPPLVTQWTVWTLARWQETRMMLRVTRGQLQRVWLGHEMSWRRRRDWCSSDAKLPTAAYAQAACIGRSCAC